jgi:hypothetical protein
MWDWPKHLDLSVVYRHQRHDKVGNERLLRDFELHYFGNEHTNLSREKCEAFFDNAANFYEPPNLSRFLTKESETEVLWERDTQNSSKPPLIETVNCGEETRKEKSCE